MTGQHVLFPGTFDPITLGHLDLIERSLAIFERVTVLVAAHASKSQLFSADQRVEQVREALCAFDRVEVASTSGLLVDACREHGCHLVLRGVRGAVDLEYETQMANTNRAMLPTLDTLFLSANPEQGFISSTLVRQIASMGGDVSSFVPGNVLADLQSHFSS
jgi:pantetheine-phosphate adenylyltransferase